jgi:hypothetical protein
MRIPLLLVMAGSSLLTWPSISPAQPIIPAPARLTAHAGHFTITAETVIWTDPPSASIGRQLARYLEPATGFTLDVVTGGTSPTGSIALLRDPEASGKWQVSSSGYGDFRRWRADGKEI